LATSQIRFTLTGHYYAANIEAIAFTADSTIAASSDSIGNVLCWEASSGKRLATLKANVGCTSAAVFSPDGRSLITAGGESGRPPRPGEVVLWDVANWERKEVWHKHSGYVSSLSLAADGETVATTGYHDPQVIVWNVLTGQEKAVFVVPSPPKSPPTCKCVLSADGRTLAVNDVYQGIIWLYDCDTKQLRATFDRSKEPDVRGAMDKMALSPDGALLAALGEGYHVVTWDHLIATKSIVKIWDTRTLQLRARFRIPSSDSNSEQATNLAFSPDGKTLLLDSNKLLFCPVADLLALGMQPD
jgi:WD40 repeat protein